MKESEFSEFPAEEYARRAARARKLMQYHEIDALLLSQQENVRYLSGYPSILWASKFRPLLMLLPCDESRASCLILPTQEAGNAGISHAEETVFWNDQENPVDTVVDTLHRWGLQGKAVGTELGYGSRLGMAIVQWEELSREFEEGTFVDATPLMQELRRIKSPLEVEAMRRSCQISCAAVEEGWKNLRKGMTERELAGIITSTMLRLGGEPLKSFVAMNAGPARYQVVNSMPSDYALRRGDLVMIDGGACYKGYCTDFIRQACLGEPTPRQRELFDLCVAANDDALAAIGPGAVCADVYEAGQKRFIEAGYGEHTQINIIGHSSGLEVHELPYVGAKTVPTTEIVMEPGMIFNIEPIIAGVDSDDWSTGVFIVEDVVVVTEDGCEVLTRDLSKELWVADI